MFGPISLQGSMSQLCKAETGEEFEHAVSNLTRFLKDIGVDADCLMGIESRAFYFPNSYNIFFYI